MNYVNQVWKQKVKEVFDLGQVAKPRDLYVTEVLNGTYTVPMPAYLSLKDRKVNKAFMFAEAAWIISGSNRLSDITPYMARYSQFSDDGLFLKGAYGPKVVDQLPYVVDSLLKDRDTRQAVLTTWRERPGPSKDVPCTLSMQFLIRNNKLNLIVNMRSHDIVLGFTYDVFTFSMVAEAVRLLLGQKNGPYCELGHLYVNAGSLHLYEDYYDRARQWLDAKEEDLSIQRDVFEVLGRASSYDELIESLRKGADELV